jgi:hypothetical protein
LCVAFLNAQRKTNLSNLESSTGLPDGNGVVNKKSEKNVRKRAAALRGHLLIRARLLQGNRRAARSLLRHLVGLVYSGKLTDLAWER